MQVVRNILILLILLPIAVMFLMPKKELYYMLEKKLSMQNIIIAGEALEEGTLSLTIKHPVFYFGGAPIATAKDITIWSLLMYTKADITEMLVAEGLATETSIVQLHAVHSIFSPLRVQVEGESSLGALHSEIKLDERYMRINMSKGSTNRAFTKILKKSKEGWYYESKF
jgi:hypothetical protein